MPSNHQLLLCPLRKIVREWVWFASYDPTLGCTSRVAPTSRCRPFPACPPCAVPSGLAVVAKFVASTRTASTLDPNHAFPPSHTLSMAPSHPTSVDFPTLLTGCRL
ncbi:hypothetical protein GOBAR_DD18185 [Gossypium barbadense]|nr:hypothetical protein GOBAR_DD18185 [Gossypium barbadense]